MTGQNSRIVEVRLIVLVTVDVRHPTLVDAIRTSVDQSVSAIVAAEVVSNLESVDYVHAVVTSPL